MFKVISAEIKKIVSKPGIYILSVLLALILVLGVFIYNPEISQNTNYELKGITFVEKYTDFTGAGQANTGKKAEADKQVNDSISSINNYTIHYLSETYNQKNYIEKLLAKCNELLNTYQDCSSDNSYQNQIYNIKNDLVEAFENLNTSIETAFINSKQGSFTILSTKENYDLYTSTYKSVIAWAKTNVDKENLTSHFAEFENKYSNNFYSSIENFKYPTLSDEFINVYTSTDNDSKLSILNKRLNIISNEIEETQQKALNDSDFNTKYASKMDELANLYTNTANTFSSLIKYELIANAFTYVSTSEELKMLYLSEYSNFNSNSLLKRYEYLFENNKSESDFGKPLTIGLTSNDKINCYDYSYFVLKIFSFVIICYSIMSACHSIAGEIKEGSMRYLAIRPVSRTKLFFGKWLSIIFMSTILMIFSLIISICVGFAVYGGSYNQILTIFNGSIAFTIHPLGMIGIYLSSMLFELVIYSLLAMLFSALFKSDLMSMTILLVLYLLNTIVPIFIQGSNTWLAFYPFSHISLYSLFGSSVYAVPNNFFNLVFGAKVYAGTNITLTISMIVLITIVVSFIAVKVFKRKEL